MAIGGHNITRRACNCTRRDVQSSKGLQHGISDVNARILFATGCGSGKRADFLL
jgi:hypothetical protein